MCVWGGGGDVLPLPKKKGLVLTWEFEILAILKGRGGGEFPPFKMGRKQFQTAIRNL